MMKPSGKDNKVLNLLFSQTKNFIFYAISITAIIVLGIIEVLIVKSFINQVIVDELYTKISDHVLPFVITFSVITVFTILRNNCKAKMIANIAIELSENAYRSILSSDYNESQHAENKGYVDRIIANSQIISYDYLGMNILPFIETIASIVGIMIAAFFVQPIIALIMLLLTPFYCMIVKGTEIYSLKIKNNYQESLINNQTKITNTYNNLKNIKLLNGAEQEKEELNFLSKEYSNSFATKTFFEGISKSISLIVFTGVLLACLLGIGGVLYPNNNVNAGTFLFYTIASPIFYYLLYRSLHYKILPNEVEEARKELNKISSLRSENRAEPITNLDEIHTVKFKDIVCINNKNQKIVDGINFEVKRGEKVGIFAVDIETKQAIFDCITKISRPKEGEISINNCDITKINPVYLRTLITSMFAGSSVFNNNTFIENVCYPENFDEYKYNDALYRSGLKNIVSLLPEKDNTVISEKFSESYKNIEEEATNFMKRLVFANAFYKDSKIYVLCDATQGLSPTVESEILSEVFKLKNKIVIMLTDKAYLLSKCDKILIVEDGKTIEYGKYSELMSNKESVYYKMIKKVSNRKAKIS